MPGSKVRMIEERPGIERELIDSDPCHAAEHVGLQRNGDELLDLSGRQAERLGLNLDVGLAEFRECVDGRVAQEDRATGDGGGGKEDDEQVQAGATVNQAGQHAVRPPSRYAVTGGVRGKVTLESAGFAASVDGRPRWARGRGFGLRT